MDDTRTVVSSTVNVEHALPAEPTDPEDARWGNRFFHPTTLTETFETDRYDADGVYSVTARGPRLTPKGNLYATQTCERTWNAEDVPERYRPHLLGRPALAARAREALTAAAEVVQD